MTGKKMIQFGKVTTYRALVLCGALVFSAAGASANKNPEDQVQKSFEKTITLTGSQGVSLDNRFGNVHVSGGSGRDVKINATIHVQAKSKEEA